MIALKNNKKLDMILSKIFMHENTRIIGFSFQLDL
jgi:hypothetical protein